MTVIVEAAALAEFCARQSAAPYVTVDTEFMREKTFWPKLCLVQVAGPDEAVCIDPLAEGMNLAPLYALLADPKVLKVFHAARQDVEIFLHQSGAIPAPLFDTQVAGMVCSFGDSASYEVLVAKLAGKRIDKSSRFTDWSHRPLSRKQIDYALSDVIHLRTVYEKLARKLSANGRAAWLDEEMAILTDPATYDVQPINAWKRIKGRGIKPRALAVLREVAAWREAESQKRDLPRNRLVREEALLEIAHHPPATVDDLARIRGLGRGFAEGALGAPLLAAVARGLALPEAECPRPEAAPDLPRNPGAAADLLKVLLRIACDQAGVASKLVASASEVEELAALGEEANIPALHGWRHEIFGEAALKLRRGELAIAVDGKKFKLIQVDREGV